MTPSKLMILLLLLLLLAPTQSTDTIDQICQKTPSYSLCLATLEPNSQPISTTDPKSLTSVMANLILSNATDTLGYIQQLIKQATDPDQEKDLANCAELYIPVVKYNIPQAIDALSRGRFGFAGYAISDTAKQAEACEKGFSGGSPLTTRNQDLEDLCHVAVAIVNTLVKGRKG